MKKNSNLLFMMAASACIAMSMNAHAQDDVKTTIMDLASQSSNVGMCMAHQDYLNASQSQFPESKDFNRENIGVLETCNVEVGKLKLEKTKLLLEGVVSQDNQKLIDEFVKNSERIGYCDTAKSIESKFKTSENVEKMPYFNFAAEKNMMNYLNISAQSQIAGKCSEIFTNQRKLFATIREM